MSSTSYFRGEYRKDKDEIKSIDAFLVPVWQTLASCQFEEGFWPYELEDGATVVGDKPSISTTAMILFSLCVELGYLSKHHFSAPDAGSVHTGSQISVEDRSNLKIAVVKSLKWLSLETGKPVPGVQLSKSGSFGDDDPFSVSWLFSVLIACLRNSAELQLDIDDSDFIGLWGRTCKAISVVLSRVVDAKDLNDCVLLSKVEKASPHAFPMLRTIRICELISEISSPDDTTFQTMIDFASGLEASRQALRIKSIATLKDALKDPSEINLKIRRKTIHNWFAARLHQHLSFAEIRDAPFDAAELAFSLEGYLLGDGVRKDSPYDPDLLNRVFSILKSRQEINPYWRPLKPFVTNKQGFALLPLSVEIVNSLFRTCAILHNQNDGRFSRHVEIYRRYFEWIASRKTHGKCTVRAKQTEFTGWHSEHLQQRGCVHTWETSQVAIYLLQYREMLQEHLASRSADAANLSIRKVCRKDDDTRMTPSEYWEKHSVHKDPLPKSDCEVYKSIQRHFLDCRVNGGSGRTYFSMVLYGPPGTGKTEIAKGLAEALQWTFIEITPSDFVASGEAEVELRAKEIFEALKEQDETVILLDEIDRLILDRDSALYSKQGDMFQVMTPGMLPKLKDLRSQRRCIFIIATNYFERIDPAAIRVGRIDHHYLVGLPNQHKRKEILHTEITDEITNQLKADVIDSSASHNKVVLVLADLEQIAATTVLFTYGELCELVRTAVPDLIDRKAKTIVKDDLLSGLVQRALKHPPTVRLAAYSSRFKACLGGKELLTINEPQTEFLHLLSLVCEAGSDGRPLTPNDKQTATQIVVAICNDAKKPIPALTEDNIESKMATLLIECAESIPLESLKSIATHVAGWLDKGSLKGTHNG